MRALVCLFNSMNKVNHLLESRLPFSKEVSQTSYHIYIMLKWLKKIFCLWSWYVKIKIILKLLSNADLLRQTCVRPHIIKLKWTAHWNTCIYCYLCKPAYLQCLDVYQCKLLCIRIQQFHCIDTFQLSQKANFLSHSLPRTEHPATVPWLLHPSVWCVWCVCYGCWWGSNAGR